MAESLRDQLSKAYETVVDGTVAPETGAEPAEVGTPAATPSGATGTPPASRIATALKEDRPRAPDGKFVEKKEETPKAPQTAAAPVKAPAATPPIAGTQTQGAAAAPKLPRPKAWKKDYEPHWEKLVSGQPMTPQEASALATYMGQRETEFQHGVATYKQEWEHARPIVEAMQPFLPELQRYGIQPAQWIGNLGQAHRVLALGQPQQKLQAFAKLAQDYGVPLQALVDPTAQQQYLAQPQTQFQPQGPSPLTREEALKLWQEQFAQHASSQEVERFSADAENHPYYEQLRETMAQLLEAGLAEDLASAEQAALRHPRHADLWNAVQEQERAKQEAERAKVEAARVAQAKGKAVSPRTATPGAQTEEKPKDRRSQLEAAWDERIGSARV